MEKAIIKEGGTPEQIAKCNFMINIFNLRTVANYANDINKSVAGVYYLRDKKEVSIIKIDGVNFVKVD